ncbi:hypothetical protein KUTeg_021139, partial [Tegillarca granosa]
MAGFELRFLLLYLQYLLMLKCWTDTPGDRPTFQEVSDELKQFIQNDDESDSVTQPLKTNIELGGSTEYVEIFGIKMAIIELQRAPVKLVPYRVLVFRMFYRLYSEKNLKELQKETFVMDCTKVELLNMKKEQRPNLKLLGFVITSEVAK